MKMTKVVPALILILTATFFLTAADTSVTMEDFFKVKSFQGKAPRSIKFSADDKFVAFMWNPYNKTGYDLHIYNIETGKLTAVTSIERMKTYDPPADYKKFLKKEAQRNSELKLEQDKFFAQRDYLAGKNVDLSGFEKAEIEKLKKELAEKKKKKEQKASKKKLKKSSKKASKKAKKKKKKKELELWELRDKLKKKKKKDKIKRKDLYPGISRFVWSEKGTDLIFTYRGDLYRYFPLEDKTERLTMTDDTEKVLRYSKDDSSFYFTKDGMIFKMSFNSPFTLQINPELPEKEEFEIDDTVVSPDGKWMVITGSKEEGKPAYRKVQIMDYNRRFAKAIKVKRQVTDDKRNEATYRMYLKKVSNTNYGDTPKHIFEIPGGDVWYEFSKIIWNEQSNTFAFMTWEREKGDLKIWTCLTEKGRKPQILFRMKETVGYKSTYYNNIRFTPDGKYLIAILNNKDGFRQPFRFDLQTGIRKELVKGRFETFPVLGFSKDSKYMYALSDKQDTAMRSIYRIDIQTGEMVLKGKKSGTHSNGTVSHNTKWIASSYGNWNNPSELYLINTSSGEKKALTDSHNRDEFKNLNRIQPELFSYKNRHGHTIKGMVFKPEGWSSNDNRPSIVYFYGGPLGRRHTVQTGSFHRLAYMFQMAMAVRHGYVTICIDPRGQSGYGRDFNEANFKNPGKPQTEDLEDLAKHIDTAMGVDKNRIGIHGWSFGGFQTMMTLFTSPDTFACGIATAGPTEWENYNSWYSGATIDKSVRKKPTLRRHSLIPLAKHLKKPLLLVHGMMDPNVLYQDTVNIYRALLLSGKETLVDLFLDPEGKHGLNGAVKSKGVFNKYEAFFNRHLGKVEKSK